MADHKSPLKHSDAIAAELEAARAEHERWMEASDIYAGNTPDKYLSEIERCAQEVTRLERLLSYLRERGE